MNSMKEFESIVNNMYQDTRVILSRPDRVQKQLLIESWIEFGIKLNKLNLETQKILNDDSWRKPK